MVFGNLVFSEGFPALEACCVGLEDKTDLVAHSTELVEHFLLGSRGMGRVVKAPVESVHLSRKHGAGLIGVAADGDDRVDVAAKEFLEVFGGVAGDIDPDFLEDLDGPRVDIASGLGACAGDFDEISGSGAKDSLGKVAPAGVSGAEDEYERFHRE
jgi:hypothetical protein